MKNKYAKRGIVVGSIFAAITIIITAVTVFMIPAVMMSPLYFVLFTFNFDINTLEQFTLWDFIFYSISGPLSYILSGYLLGVWSNYLAKKSYFTIFIHSFLATLIFYITFVPIAIYSYRFTITDYYGRISNDFYEIIWYYSVAAIILFFFLCILFSIIKSRSNNT